MINYTIAINAVRCADQDGLTDVVKQIDFTMTGTDGDCSFSLPGSIKTGVVDPETFVQFADLTEAQVQAWVEEDPSAAGIKAHIALVVERMVAEAALAAKPLPWAPAPTPEPAPAP